MNKNEMLEPLIRFNRRAGEINKTEFTEFIYDKENRLEIKYNGKLSIKRTGPSIENIKAFTLDFRFFIQDKETSFRKLKKHYDKLPIPGDFKKMFNNLRDGFNYFLDNGKSIVKHNSKNITYRELLWTFVYGKLSHEDERYVGTVKQWTSNEIITELLWLDLIFIFSGGFRNINAIRDLNDEVINYIKNMNDS